MNISASGQNRQTSVRHGALVGFTIVELLIVVVVIAVLAAITIAAFNGIQNRAKESALRSATSQAAKKVIAIAAQNNDIYPADKTEFLAKAALSESSSLEYVYMTTDSLKGFCISTDNPSDVDNAYAISSGAGSLVQGTCIKNFIVNPGMETSSASWNSRRNAVITRTTSQQRSGVASLSVVTPGVDVDEGVNTAISNTLPAVGVAGNYTGSAWVKGTSGVVVRLFVEEYSATNTYINGSATSLTLNGGWQRVSATKLVASATSKVAVNVRTLNMTATTFYADDVMVNAGTRAYQYGDGYSSGWLWSGDADMSTSIGPANY